MAEQEITIEIQFFGAFRQYGENVALSVPSGSDVQTIKDALAATLAMEDDALIYDSAVASENEIIGADATFDQDTTLAILPPVCGG